MSGERVAQGVGAHPVLETGALRVALDDLVEALARETGSAPVQEQPTAGAAPARGEEHRAPARAVDPQRSDGLTADRHEPLLRALAARAHDPLLEVHVLQLEPDRL